MIENNAIPISDWVRLNVGGKVGFNDNQIFQTTKDTLSRCPESFLARLVNSGIPSEKDESGAYLLDSDPAYFRIILNYLRRGVLILDDNKLSMEGLLSEADFYNIQSLIDKIRKAMSTNGTLERSDETMPKHMSPVSSRIETVTLYSSSDNLGIFFHIECSAKDDNYEVLQALRAKFTDIEKTVNGRYYLWSEVYNLYTNQFWKGKKNQKDVEGILASFNFIQESREVSHTDAGALEECWKFVRTISK